MMKKLAALIFATAISSSAFALSFNFNHGLMATMTSTGGKSFEPAAQLDGFCSGQLNLGKYFTLRGEFSFRTDYFGKDPEPVEDIDATFNLNEVSFNFIRPFAGVTHSFSLFAGTFEPVGSGLLLQRQFGVKSFGSRLTESYLGQKSGNIYDFFGYGGAYTARFGFAPICAGFVICSNDKNLGDHDQIVGNLRLALSYRYLQLEASAGCGMYFDNKDSNGNKCIIYIDSSYLHAGVDMLLGDRDNISVLLQCGFDNYPIKEGLSVTGGDSNKETDFDIEDCYVLVEPRVKHKNVTLSTTVFNIPDKRREKLYLIENAAGIAQKIEVNAVNLWGADVSVGAIGMLSFSGKDLTDFKYLVNGGYTDELKDFAYLKICPYIDMHFMKGTFKTVCQINTTKLKNSEGQAIKLNMGYSFRL